MAINYEILDRNSGLITKEEQESIAGLTILIAGCGLGSLIAIAAARIGFHKFILVDRDRVEASNLNRQEFAEEDIGKDKVVALAERLKKINRHIETTVYAEFVTPENALSLVDKSDIVIDTIDPLESPSAVLSLHKQARKQSKTVIYPLDSGWGGGAFVFTKESVSLEEMLGYSKEVDIDDLSPEEVKEKFMAYYFGIIPEYFGEVMTQIQAGNLDHIPQPISAAYVATAISVIALKRVAIGKPVKVAPEMISFDPHQAHLT